MSSFRKRHRVARRFFSVEEVQRILAAAPEPYRTFYWLAVETGMRAGELCGLSVSDIDFGTRFVERTSERLAGENSIAEE